MKKSIIILFLAIGGLLVSCKKDDSLPPSHQGSLTAFEVALSKTNNLRAEVTATFSTETSYHIAYWETANPQKVQQTNTYKATGITLKTLLFLKPNTDYTCQIITTTGVKSPLKTFKTKSIETFLPNATLLEDKFKEKIEGFLLANNRSSKHIYLMDMNGTVVWYEPVPDTPAVVNYNPRTQQF